MSPLLFICGSILLLLMSGLASLFGGAWQPFPRQISSLCGLSGAAIGLISSLTALTYGAEQWLTIPCALPGGAVSLGLDALSAFFLAPVFLLGGLGSIYKTRYWEYEAHPRNFQRCSLFWGGLQAGMALVVISRNAILFLFGWELMALSAYFLITAEDESAEVRKAGWIYLVAAHVSALCLFALFALMREVNGSFELTALREAAASDGMRLALFLLALVGFGFKMGFIPLHFWLPEAHANAPSHVSAILSGVMIKMGVYGLMRILMLLPLPPVSWGVLVLALGGISALFGVILAIGQHDLKKLLAYHSVENIGIILMGLGLGMIGLSLGRKDMALLGISGCLLHVWNHGLFKSLLFLGAGSVLHAVGTREIDRLGGLAKRMPWTALYFLVGALSICGLPPFNGFVSEFLIYLGFFRALMVEDGGSFAGAALGAPLLAMVGALAVACFVKVYGIVFLGEPRSRQAADAHEVKPAMLAPMMALATACLTIGLAPFLAAPLIENALAAWMKGKGAVGEGMRLMDAAPLGWIALIGLALALLAGLPYALRLRAMAAAADRTGTWDCGYAAPTPSMQYTASSFAQMLVDQFSWLLHPRRNDPEVKGLFPQRTSFSSHVEDFALNGVIMPAARGIEAAIRILHSLPHRRIQVQLLYIFMIIGMLLLWGSLGI